MQRNALSRRDWLKRFAAAVAVTGHCAFSPEAAARVHTWARQEAAESGVYAAKYFKLHEFKTLQRLAELIIPADERSGSAAQAGAPQFIDLLCSQNQELADLYSGGLVWLDGEMRKREGRAFLEAGEDRQIQVLEELDAESRRQQAARASEGGAVYRENTNYGGFRDYGALSRGELEHGVRFFDWLRRMTVDAFYTSPMGIEDVGYQGNQFLNEYEVPAEVLAFLEEK